MHRHFSVGIDLLRLAAAAVLLTAVLFGVVRLFKPNSPDEAGWVQGIGSIAGILAAIWIAHGDSRQAKKARQEEDRALYGSAREVLERAAILVRQIATCELWDGLSSRCDPRHLEATCKAMIKRDAEEIYAVLAAFPVERLAAIGLIDVVIQVRRAMGEIAAEACYYNFDCQGRLAGSKRQQFTDVKQWVDDAMQKLATRR